MRVEVDAADAMRAHALETYPDECCGALVIDEDGKQHVLRMRNIQNEMNARDPERFPRTARTAYSPDPADFKAAVDRWESPGYSLAAFYHSHPDHDAYFSDEDVHQATAAFGEPAYPDALQIVISIYGEEIRVIRAFAWSGDEETFVQTPIEVD